MPPNNAKAVPARERLSTSAPTSTNDNADGSRRRRSRHVPGQLPLVVAATVYPPALGLVTAIIVLDDVCPDCGDWHNHRVRWPVGALIGRRARCGAKYELALHRPKVNKRGRRVKAAA